MVFASAFMSHTMRMRIMRSTRLARACCSSWTLDSSATATRSASAATSATRAASTRATAAAASISSKVNTALAGAGAGTGAGAGSGSGTGAGSAIASSAAASSSAAMISSHSSFTATSAASASAAIAASSATAASSAAIAANSTSIHATAAAASAAAAAPPPPPPPPPSAASIIAATICWADAKTEHTPVLLSDARVVANGGGGVLTMFGPDPWPLAPGPWPVATGHTHTHLSRAVVCHGVLQVPLVLQIGIHVVVVGHASRQLRGRKGTHTQDGLDPCPPPGGGMGPDGRQLPVPTPGGACTPQRCIRVHNEPLYRERGGGGGRDTGERRGRGARAGGGAPRWLSLGRVVAQWDRLS